LTLQICWALNCIHQAKDVGGKEMQIIHRDITPGNIVVSESGMIKIIDFGSATSNPFRQKVSNELFRNRFQYLPPELLEGKTMNQGLDLFSLGVVLYQMATGTTPFQGEKNSDILDDMLRDKPISPTKINPDYNRTESKMILKLLRKNPDKRFVDAQDLLEALMKAAKKRGLIFNPSELASQILAES
jgi:serine/threonine-protein kinase